MAAPIRNLVYDKICAVGSLTDGELFKALAKSDIQIAEDRFNKILLDLEIMGLISVSWLTKDTRRVEMTEEDEKEDGIVEDRNYEASFPGAG